MLLCIFYFYKIQYIFFSIFISIVVLHEMQQNRCISQSSTVRRVICFASNHVAKQ
ncbi:hypothetical protein BMW23_1114 [Bodo saltans virus]|uniref:Uncharacterized protein n=1 Tax=Bodo saltans virus TaxID=2024608 RepID=A0A2H4UW87_9VIRU|nr:hypothetical protein QJ851_gp1094 [Bodo saltans virus]ATZ81157.1 hypothetical protein BMW23_1114 [Bodo saltans virus]